MMRGPPVRLRTCPRCGSSDLRWPAASEGPVGQGVDLPRYLCRACDWQGVPLEFVDEASRLAFQEAVRSAGPPRD